MPYDGYQVHFVRGIYKSYAYDELWLLRGIFSLSGEPPEWLPTGNWIRIPGTRLEKHG